MADQSNPFMNFDFSKILAEATAPGADMEALIAAQKKNTEALVSAGQVVAEGYQTVAKRHAEILQASLSDARTQMAAATADGQAGRTVERQADYLKGAFEQAARNMKEISDVVQKTQAEAFDILRRRVNEGLDEIKDQAKS